jgi:hypothetical protein
VVTRVSEEHIASLKTNAVSSSEMFVTTYYMTWHHKPEDDKFFVNNICTSASE